MNPTYLSYYTSASSINELQMETLSQEALWNFISLEFYDRPIGSSLGFERDYPSEDCV